MKFGKIGAIKRFLIQRVLQTLRITSIDIHLMDLLKLILHKHAAAVAMLMPKHCVLSRLNATLPIRLSVGVVVISNVSFIMPAFAAKQCVLTSQVNPAITIRMKTESGYAFPRAVIYDGSKSIGLLGYWTCSTGGSCSFVEGELGDPTIIGMRYGQPTAYKTLKPNSYLLPGLVLGDKWNTRLRSSATNLWSRGKGCTLPAYDFP